MDRQTAERTERLIGGAGTERLARARVAVFGVGGVGGYAVEALARAGVGALDLIDNDKIAPSNINRQIIATLSTIGIPKVEAFAARIRDINPSCEVGTYQTFVLPETIGTFDFSRYDYVIDAIDTVAGKIAIVLAAKAANVPIISAMGAGRKLDPTAFRVADLYKTSVCPLARVMRTELRKRNVRSLKVVYSEEPARAPLPLDGEESARKREGGERGAETRALTAPPEKRTPPGSISFVPSVAGLILAGEVVRDLLRDLL